MVALKAHAVSDGVSGHGALAAAAAVAGLVALGVLTEVIRRRPEAFALLAFAALPFRVPVAIGSENANLLLPLYAVIAAGALAYALRRRVRPMTPSRVRPVRGTSAAPGRDRAGDRDRALRGAVGLFLGHLAGDRLGLLLLRAVRRAVATAARRAVDQPAAAPGVRRGRGAGAAVRGGWVRRGRDGPAADIERQGARGQRDQALLPRELAVLRPEHLRALPGADDDRARGGAAGVAARAPDRRGRRRAGGAVGGDGPVAVAVELRGAPAWAARAGGAAVAPARRGRRRRRARSWSAARSWSPRPSRWGCTPEARRASIARPAAGRTSSRAARGWRATGRSGGSARARSPTTSASASACTPRSRRRPRTRSP